MSRSGYADEWDDSDEELEKTIALWRAEIKEAVEGESGQAFLREMLGAMDALPAKRLIPFNLVAHTGETCALGSVCVARGLDVTDIEMDDEENPDVHYQVAEVLKVPHALACEVMWANDDAGKYDETPEERFARMRLWIEKRVLA